MDQFTRFIMRLASTPRWARASLVATAISMVATLFWFWLPRAGYADRLLNWNQFLVLFLLAFVVRVGLYAWAIRFWLNWKRQRLDEESDATRRKAARLSALRAEVGFIAIILATEYIVWQAFMSGSGQ